MRTRHYAFVAALAVAFCRQAGAQPIAGPIASPVNGHSYYLLASDSWTASESEAITLGGNLATVRNSAENNWIFDTFSSIGGVDRDLWIGLYDPTEGAEATDYVWVDGEPVEYTDWTSGGPTNVGNEYYTEIIEPGFGDSGLWNDFPDNAYPDRPTFGVLEVVPEPATYTVGLGAALLLLASRQRSRIGNIHLRK